MTAQVERSEFIAGIKDLAAADLALDTANPTPDLIQAILRLTDKVPELRVVLDHLPNLAPPAESKPKMTGAEILAEWEREDALGSFTDRPDSPEFARRLRQLAEMRGDRRV